MTGPEQATITTVAETLRYAAHWSTDDADDLRAVAAELDTGDIAAWICCPVCQEITCDADCPLRTVRSARDGGPPP